jgi:hypothetical protein
MIWMASATHWSQIYTFGPATNLGTSASLLPQKEQANCLRQNMFSASVAEVPAIYPFGAIHAA